jgi:hypothetical protein
MPKQPSTTPVGDTVPKIDGEIAVGEDIRFQRRWWVFERVIWTVFVLVIICDAAGLFGHGWLSKAKASVPDGSVTVEYERVERSSTPSSMFLHLGTGAMHDGQVRVFISDSIVKDLGAIRIAPQPAVSAVGHGGITYTFPTTASPAEIEIQLQPNAPGKETFRIQVEGKPAIIRSVLVLP